MTEGGVGAPAHRNAALLNEAHPVEVGLVVRLDLGEIPVPPRRDERRLGHDGQGQLSQQGHGFEGGHRRMLNAIARDAAHRAPGGERQEEPGAADTVHRHGPTGPVGAADAALSSSNGGKA